MADIEVPQPGASEIVARLLSDALQEHPDVQWLGLVSEDGFAIASEGSVSVNDDAVAAGAVRMMIQVRAMSKALGQSGTSQMFLEGSESGVCVIDKDPWVLIVMGAPGVPIGLLRYEAREIAEAFPVGARPALMPADSHEDEMPGDWTVVPGAGFVDGEDRGDEPDLVSEYESADASDVTDSDGEPEIRWADEPTTAATAVGLAVADSPDGHDIFGEAGMEGVEELEMPSVGAEDLTDWLEAGEQPAEEPIFDLSAAGDEAPVTFEMPDAEVRDDGQAQSAFEVTAEPAPVFDVAPEPVFGVEPEVSFDLSAGPQESSPFDLPAPVGAGFDQGMDDLSDLAPPSGPAIDLPPPAGPAYELPPPE